MDKKFRLKIIIISVVALLLIGGVIIASLTISRVKYEKRDGYYVVVGVTGKPKSIVIKAEIKKKPVTEISTRAFENLPSLKAITIPSSVTKIGEDVLKGCINLEEMTVPFTSEVDSLTYYFGVEQNRNLPESLKKVTITSASIIKARTFSEITSLTEVVLPDTVTEIEEKAFEKCANLFSFTFPNELKIIGEEAFRDCWNLKTLSFPNKLESIGKFAFYNCQAVWKVEMTSSVTHIGEGAFSHCQMLDEVTLSSALREIAPRLFDWCTRLRELVLGDHIKTIGEEAFNNAVSLETINFPNGLYKIEKRAFYNCKKLRNYTLPENVIIGEDAFGINE